MKPFPDARLRKIRTALAAWYQANKRDLPWRRTRDPYRVWISEIMLQQTRVAAVIPYYERFLARFPSIQALAAAADAELLTAWAGLGYYTRARNLRKAAQMVTAFPATYAEILALPGIGPYTAAALASICFGLPHAVLDGNVMRVLARLSADAGELTASATRRRLQSLAQRLLDPALPAEHNQAAMELGAVVCTPRNPDCESCPIRKYCLAKQSGLERELPVAGRKVAVRRVRRTLLVVRRKGRILLWQRAGEKLMPGFWELPEPDRLPAATPGKFLHRFRHAITDHVYEFEVFSAPACRAPATMRWLPLDDLAALPLSTVARKALEPVVRQLAGFRKVSNCEILE